MSIASEEVGGIVVLSVAERLDVSTAPALREVVESLFERAGRDAVIDLERVTYISSVGLSVLLRGAQLAQMQGGRVVLSGPSGVVRSIIEIAGLDRVLGIHPTRAAALASFEAAEPRRASGARDLDTGLTLAEEILLLALHDESGRLDGIPPHALEFALAGAVLLELCMLERIDSDLELVTVVDSKPVGDPLLDSALDAIASSPVRHGADTWVATLAREGAEIQRRVVERLLERKVLRRKDSMLHRVLGGRRFPVIEDKEQREVRERVLGILQRREVPGPRDVAIIALADACAVFDAILDMEAMLDVRPRIAEVARMDLVAQAMNRALQAAQASGGRDGAAHGVFT